MSEEQNITEENAESKKLKKKDMNESIAPDKSIGQTQSSIANQQPPTENMEVHHHPDLHHRKKHWKEYFLEFLMIFLAVTLGFFAENIRESITDSHRGKEYIKSLAQDLIADTASLNGHIHAWSGQIVNVDS